MTEELKKIIEETTLKFPEKIKGVINESNWIEKTKETGEKYLLNEEEINLLQAETSLVILGIIEKDFFLINLESRIGLSKNEATKISEEIDKNIFIPIEKQLKDTINIINPENFKNLEKTIKYIVSGGKII